VLAHVRGVADEERAVISPQNLHPFRFDDAGVALAHNGHLRQFDRMRYALLDYVRPELARRVRGTTDSEWLYVLLLSQLAEPLGTPDAEELAAAVVQTLEIVRRVRAEHGIETASPANLFATTGSALVATRFSFDHGWYPEGHDPLLELDLAYVTLWYTVGREFSERDGEWVMRGGDDTAALLVASEPITTDVSTWLEVPEYSLLVARRDDGRIATELRDLDV
jgi:glutamine amidotransferase